MLLFLRAGSPYSSSKEGAAINPGTAQHSLQKHNYTSHREPRNCNQPTKILSESKPGSKKQKRLQGPKDLYSGGRRDRRVWQKTHFLLLQSKHEGDEKLWGIVKGIPTKPEEKEPYVTLQVNGSSAGTYHIMLLIYVQIGNAREWQNEHRQWTSKGSTKLDPVRVGAACDRHLSSPSALAVIWHPTCTAKIASLNPICVQSFAPYKCFFFFFP